MKPGARTDPNAAEFFCWTPASTGEPPVTDSQFAVLLINSAIGEPFLRPHYPGAKKPIPEDCYWVLLPQFPQHDHE